MRLNKAVGVVAAVAGKEAASQVVDEMVAGGQFGSADEAVALLDNLGLLETAR